MCPVADTTNKDIDNKEINHYNKVYFDFVRLKKIHKMTKLILSHLNE